MLLALEEGLKGIVHTVGDALYEFARTLGGPGLFLIALADSSFLSLPEGNDLLIVVLSTGQGWTLMSYYATMTVLGSVAGCSLLYWVGRRGVGFFERRTSKQRLERARLSYQRWGFWAVLVPSILPPPTPFKVFVLSAGLFRLSFPKFFLTVFIGRSIRYFTWGILAVLYGEMVKQFIEKNLPTVGVVIAIMLVLIVAAVLIRLHQESRKSRSPV